MATLDLRPIARAPLRFHANVNYYLDNSSNLYDFDGTTTANTREVAMFAYGIAASRVRFGAGRRRARSSATPGRCRCARSPSTTPRSSPRRADPAFAGHRERHATTAISTG